MHTWDHFHSLFRPVPRLPEAAAPGPLHLRATDAAGPSGPRSSISPGLFWTPGGPPPSPQVRAGEKQPSSLLCFRFPFTSPPAHLTGPQQQHWRPPGNTAVRTPTRRWFSKGNKGQLAGQPGQCGTTLLTQETELLFFFPLKTNKKIYIYIFIFSCRVAPEQVCMVTQSVDSPNLKLRIEARSCSQWAGAQ